MSMIRASKIQVSIPGPDGNPVYGISVSDGPTDRKTLIEEAHVAICNALRVAGRHSEIPTIPYENMGEPIPCLYCDHVATPDVGATLPPSRLLAPLPGWWTRLFDKIDGDRVLALAEVIEREAAEDPVKWSPSWPISREEYQRTNRQSVAYDLEFGRGCDWRYLTLALLVCDDHARKLLSELKGAE